MPLWDKQECAAFLRIRTRTLDKYVALGKIPAIKLSHKLVRFDPSAVIAALP